MSGFNLTPASKKLVNHYVTLALSTGDSFLNSLLGTETRKTLSELYLDGDSLFSHKHTKFMINGENVGGMILSYPAKISPKGMLKTALRILKNSPRTLFTRLGDLLKAKTLFGPIKKSDYYICFLAVHPQFRNLGLASKMLEHAKEESLKNGCKRIILEVESENTNAIKFYKKRGFKRLCLIKVEIKSKEHSYFKMAASA